MGPPPPPPVSLWRGGCARAVASSPARFGAVFVENQPCQRAALRARPRARPRVAPVRAGAAAARWARATAAGGRRRTTRRDHDELQLDLKHTAGRRRTGRSRCRPVRAPLGVAAHGGVGREDEAADRDGSRRESRPRPVRRPRSVFVRTAETESVAAPSVQRAPTPVVHRRRPRPPRRRREIRPADDPHRGPRRRRDPSRRTIRARPRRCRGGLARDVVSFWSLGVAAAKAERSRPGGGGAAASPPRNVRQYQGVIVRWQGSSSCRGGVPP